MHEGHRERMRERLYLHGKSLTDCELLEILLYDFITRKNTNPTAHRLIDCFGDLYGVFSATPRLLSAVAGIGRQTAEKIYLLGELYGRIRSCERTYIRLYNFSEVVQYVRARFARTSCEKLELYMTREDCTLACAHTVSNVDRAKVIIDDKELSLILSEAKPSNLIVAHNHPSGKAEPSQRDDESLESIGKVCRMHGVFLRDSVIVSGEDFYSYYLHDRMGQFR